MRLADHRGIGNRGMLEQERLDLGRGDAEALNLIISFLRSRM